MSKWLIEHNRRFKRHRRVSALKSLLGIKIKKERLSSWRVAALPIIKKAIAFIILLTIASTLVK